MSLTATAARKSLRYKTSSYPHSVTGQVLVDVRAAGTNPVDYKLYSGEMGRDPAQLPMPIGMEVAGVVAAVAPGATGYTGALTVGDEVIVTNVRGGYAEQVLADGSDVGHKPASLSFEQAAGLLLVGGTAWHLLTNTDVGTGDTVLIHGASGGVGLMAVQLAVARGAKVIATASPAGTISCADTAPSPSPTAKDWPTGCGRSARWTRRWTWSAPTRPSTPRSNWSPTAGGSPRSPGSAGPASSASRC